MDGVAARGLVNGRDGRQRMSGGHSCLSSRDLARRASPSLMGGIQFLPLAPASYNSDDVALGKTDDVEKRNVCRAAVEAASALDTILYRILLKFVHHIVASIIVEQERLKTHRAGLGTFSATDTSRLDATHCLLSSKVKE